MDRLFVLFTWLFLRTGASLLIALLLHTSINVMGDLGLSGFEAASVVFFLVETAAALVVVVASPVFRRIGRS